MDARRTDVTSWRTAAGTWATAADRESERTADDGTIRLMDQWDGVMMPGIEGPGVIITLTADLYACAPRSVPTRAPGNVSGYCSNCLSSMLLSVSCMCSMSAGYALGEDRARDRGLDSRRYGCCQGGHREGG